MILDPEVFEMRITRHHRTDDTWIPCDVRSRDCTGEQGVTRCSDCDELCCKDCLIYTGNANRYRCVPCQDEHLEFMQSVVPKLAAIIAAEWKAAFRSC